MSKSTDDEPMARYSMRIPHSYLEAADRVQHQLGDLVDRAKVMRSAVALGLQKLAKNPQAALKAPSNFSNAGRKRRAK